MATLDYQGFNVIVIQNDPEVPLGAYAEYLAEAGVPYRTVQPFTGEALPGPAEVTSVIVLGGAMGVHDVAQHPFLLELKQFIRDVVALQVPFLGICLGAQLLADALGAKVTSNSPCAEKGTLPVTLTEAGMADPLFTDVSQEFITFQWHNDSFSIPTGAAHLASSPVCPNQAYRFGPNAYGVQFHPEVNRLVVVDWSSCTPETKELTPLFLARFDAAAKDYNIASRCLLFNFLRIAG